MVISTHSTRFIFRRERLIGMLFLFCVVSLKCFVKKKKEVGNSKKTTQDCWKLPPREAKYDDLYAKLRIELLEPDLQIKSSSFQYEN